MGTLPSVINEHVFLRILTYLVMDHNNDIPLRVRALRQWYTSVTCLNLFFQDEQLLEPGAPNLTQRDCCDPVCRNTLYERSVLISWFYQDGPITPQDPVHYPDLNGERSQLHTLTPSGLSETSSQSDADDLLERVELSGHPEDLETAIPSLKETLKLQPAPHPGRPMLLNKVGNALLIQFEQSGQQEDLEASISFYREALDLRPAPHPLRSMSLSNLAGALLTQFEQSGQQEDLESAIQFYREALDLRPASHPDRSMSLSNLAGALLTQFEQSSQQEDLESAISFYREALDLRPALHPDRSLSLSNLAGALLTQFEQSGQQEDIESAISFNREALDLRLAPHPDRSSSLNNLANALRTQFKASGQQEDLEAAISFYREALNSRVLGHPSARVYWTNLESIFMIAYTHIDDSEYLDKAMHAFCCAVACETAPASQRFQSAKAWAKHADPGHKSALDAYQAAIKLLPRLAMLGLDLPSRQEALTSGTDGLARAAAACAIRSGQCDKAIELLEEGRAAFWSQALQLRIPMTDLREVAPELEARLTRISRAVEQGSLRHVSQDMSNYPQTLMSIEREAARLRRLNDEWLATLEEVRQLESLKDFLQPQRLSKLLGAAAEAPVVVLNASEAGCTALTLTSNGVQHVPLVLTFAHVTALVNLIRMAIAPHS